MKAATSPNSPAVKDRSARPRRLACACSTGPFSEIGRPAHGSSRTYGLEREEASMKGSNCSREYVAGCQARMSARKVAHVRHRSRVPSRACEGNDASTLSESLTRDQRWSTAHRMRGLLLPQGFKKSLAGSEASVSAASKCSRHSSVADAGCWPLAASLFAA